MLSQPVSERVHIQGAESAAVTLLMNGAYECPQCLEGNKIVKEIQQRMGEQLRFVFRHSSRTNFHPHPEAAAKVADAAWNRENSRRSTTSCSRIITD